MVQNGAGSYANIRCTWVATSSWYAQMSHGRGMIGMCRCDGDMTHRPGMWAGLGSWYDWNVWNVGGVYANEVGGGAYVRKASDWLLS